MQTTLKPKQDDDPHDFLVVASDRVPVAPAFEPPSVPSSDAVRSPLDSQTETGTGFAAAPPVRPVDAALRPAAVADAAVPGQRRWIARPVLRVVTAVLLTVGAAVIARQSYGDAAKQMIATWALPSALTAWLPLDKLGLAAPSAPPAATPDAAQVQASQAAASAPSAPQAAAPAAAALSGDSAQLLQSMAHDLAAVGQRIDQLKASIDQLKAGQEQMARDVAKVSEKTSEKVARLAPPPIPPRPVAPRSRKPAPPYPLPQAATAPAAPQAAAPYVPRPLPPPDSTAAPLPDPELSSAPRPPMPLR